MDPKEKDGPKENDQILVTRGDSSWYKSQWHGKAHGVEVDPWLAVVPVPCLCAVILG